MAHVYYENCVLKYVLCSVFYVQCARLAEQTVKKGLVAVPVPCTYHRQTNRFTI